MHTKHVSVGPVYKTYMRFSRTHVHLLFYKVTAMQHSSSNYERMFATKGVWKAKLDGRMQGGVGYRKEWPVRSKTLDLELSLFSLRFWA